MKHRLTVISGGKTLQLEVPAGANLLKVFQENEIELYAPCGGNGTCGKCKVRLEGGLTVTACTYYVEKDIAVMLPDQQFSEIQVTQYQYTRKVYFIPGKEAALAGFPMGLAIDLGTTTIAYYLVNLITGSLVGISTAMNPQARFGGDVISRISHCMTHSGGLKELQDAVIKSFNTHLEAFAAEQGIDTGSFTKVVVAGNTTMLHILSGTDPGPIALAPFTPAFTDRLELSAAAAGLKCHPEASMVLLPSVSGYVGADIVAGIASIDDAEIPAYLYLDIGTNGEMALVTPGKIWCCATAAGPAFEGANITCGSGAFEGAISKYNREGFSTIGKAKPVSICGSGLIDLMAFLLEKGLVKVDGNMEETFLVSAREHNGVDTDIVLSVYRNIQFTVRTINIIIPHITFNTYHWSGFYILIYFFNSCISFFQYRFLKVT